MTCLSLGMPNCGSGGSPNRQRTMSLIPSRSDMTFKSYNLAPLQSPAGVTGSVSGSMDRLTKEQRRRVMQAVKSEDTQLERRLRNRLWSAGYRYRKNYSAVVGKPDVAFPSLKIAVFCDSEFWHGYDWERRKYEIKSKRDFWWPKIERNIGRDKEVTAKLRADGWKVLRFWESNINKNLDACVERIEQAVKSARRGVRQAV
jgi:DNA mismatch endonuclease Vsr